MTLSSVSNVSLAKSHLSNQKTETETSQSKKGRSNISSENGAAGKNIGDNVMLSQSEKMSEVSEVIDLKAAEELLPKTMKAILTNSNTALSAQANIKPEAAIEFLSAR
ncbi:hypothetical protein [Desulforhopalus sp. 52FAK]